jgi:hypothetical protein
MKRTGGTLIDVDAVNWNPNINKSILYYSRLNELKQACKNIVISLLAKKDECDKMNVKR